MKAVLRHRNYGVHTFVKEVELKGTVSDYIDSELMEKDSRDECWVFENKLIEELPGGFLPVAPKQILLVAGDSGQFNTKIFRSWGKYFDAYSLSLESESDET